MLNHLVILLFGKEKENERWRVKRKTKHASSSSVLEDGGIRFMFREAWCAEREERSA